MKLFTLLAILSGLFVASYSQAHETRGFYVGAGAGSTNFDDHDDAFEAYTVDVDSTTFKLIGGYQINRIIALEAQYTNYGDMNLKGTQYGWSPQALSFSANAGYTFNNGLRPFAILGMSVLDLEQSKKVFDEDTVMGVRYGLGLEYTPLALSRLSIRAGYEADFFYLEETDNTSGYYSYDKSDFSLSSVYVSASYKF